MVASNQNSRSANACEACRRRKVKCSGDQPCRGCLKHGWSCTFGHPGRRRFSEAQVQHLLDKIRSYEERLGGQASEPATLSPGASGPSSSRQGDAETSASNGRTRPAGLSYEESVSAISPATDLASGPAFESQAKSLLDRSYSSPLEPSRDTQNTNYDRPQSRWESVDTILENTADFLPSLEESQHLLEQFLFYLGSQQTREEIKRSSWYTEYLLVMAMAKLMDVESPANHPPGSALFTEALSRLPPLHHLGSEGIISVEILTLIATYLQWCDRKHDAYLHIGLALRLAIALGCNLPEKEQDCLPSQSAHRVRLWWTVYMLDRRLSSGLGLAAGADERQLRAGFPRHVAGFQSPVALNINVRIARITDEIMSSLYGNSSITQLALVKTIQDILKELSDIGRSFPTALVLDFTRPLGTVTRTGSSLYLMLFQAIILCTRPMLLRSVRLKVEQQQKTETTEVVPDMLARLCDTCSEAATRSLAILHSLQRQKTIPRYGFFDLDATFSAAFVLVMEGFINSSQGGPPPALKQAFEVLQFLAQSGNYAAEQRLQDISQSCSHVWPNHTFNISSPNQLSPRANRSVEMRGINRGDESQLLEPWANLLSTNTAFGVQDDWNIDLSGEAEDIYFSFNNPTLPLTGVDYTDWLEIEKILNGPEGLPG